MTRPKRNLRLLFIFLVIIAFLYGGFLWFARSTQVETARLHAEVGEQLEERGLEELMRETSPSARTVQRAEDESQYGSGNAAAFDDLMQELKALLMSDEWPIDTVLPCKCPEDAEDDGAPGDAAFFRAHEDMAKRFIAGLDKDEIRKEIANGDPKKVLFGWHSGSRAASDLLLSNAYLALEAGDAEQAEQYLHGLLEFSDALAGSPFIDLLHARQKVISSLLMLGNVTDLATTLPERQLDEIVFRAIQAGTTSDWAPHVLAMAWHAEEVMEDIVDTYGRGETESMLFTPFYSNVPLRLWIRTYGPFNPFTYLDRKAYVSTMLELAELLERPYYEVVADSDDPMRELLYQPKTRLLTNIFAGATVQATLHNQTRAQATARILALGLLVQRYHAEHGTCPDSLDVLEWPAGIDAETVQELLRDPYTGAPFQYTHQDGRCVVESETLNNDYMCACVKRFVFPPGGQFSAR